MSSAKPAFRFRDCCTSRPNSGFRQCRSQLVTGSRRHSDGSGDSGAEAVANDRGHVSTMVDVASTPRCLRSGIPPNRLNGPTAPQVYPDQLSRAHPVAQAPSSGLPENHTDYQKMTWAHIRKARRGQALQERARRYSHIQAACHTFLRLKSVEIGLKDSKWADVQSRIPD